MLVFSKTLNTKKLKLYQIPEHFTQMLQSWIVDRHKVKIVPGVGYLNYFISDNLLWEDRSHRPLFPTIFLQSATPPAHYRLLSDSRSRSRSRSRSGRGHLQQELLQAASETSLCLLLLLLPLPSPLPLLPWGAS